MDWTPLSAHQVVNRVANRISTNNMTAVRYIPLLLPLTTILATKMLNMKAYTSSARILAVMTGGPSVRMAHSKDPQEVAEVDNQVNTHAAIAFPLDGASVTATFLLSEPQSKTTRNPGTKIERPSKG